MLIYSPIVTERCKYIFNLVFYELLGVSYTLTDEAESFDSHVAEKICYGYERRDTGFFVQSAGLLFETGLKEQDIHVERKDLPIFYVTAGDLPFDIFSASFYLVSRYEEMIIKDRDKFGRFPAKNSLAFRHGFLDKPVVNLWVEGLKKALIQKYPSLKFSGP